MHEERPHASTLCGAKTRSGTPCRNHAMANGRCRMHGGKSLAGPAAPAFKHGRHSRYLPAHLLERYETAFSDPDLLALKSEIALLDARLGELFDAMDDGQSGAVGQAAREAYRRLKAAIQDKNPAQMAVELRALDEQMQRDEREEAAWAEIRETLEVRRRLVDSERRRLVDLRQMITAEQAMTLVALLQDAVKTYVDDPAVLAAIADHIRRGVAAEPGRRALPGRS